MYVCVCVYIYLHTHIYIHKYIHACMHTYIHTSDVLVPIFFLVLVSISSVNVYFSFDLVSVFKFILVLVFI